MPPLLPAHRHRNAVRLPIAAGQRSRLPETALFTCSWLFMIIKIKWNESSIGTLDPRDLKVPCLIEGNRKLSRLSGEFWANSTFFPLAELALFPPKARGLLLNWHQRPVWPETGIKSSIESTEKRKQESLSCSQSGLDEPVSSCKHWNLVTTLVTSQRSTGGGSGGGRPDGKTFHPFLWNCLPIFFYYYLFYFYWPSFCLIIVIMIVFISGIVKKKKDSEIMQISPL